MYAAPEVLLGQPSNEKVRGLISTRSRVHDGFCNFLDSYPVLALSGPIAEGIPLHSVSDEGSALRGPKAARGRCDTALRTCTTLRPASLMLAAAAPQADTFSYGVVLWELITKEQTERGNWRDVLVPDECPPGVEVLLKVGRSRVTNPGVPEAYRPWRPLGLAVPW